MPCNGRSPASLCLVEQVSRSLVSGQPTAHWFFFSGVTSLLIGACQEWAPHRHADRHALVQGHDISTYDLLKTRLEEHAAGNTINAKQARIMVFLRIAHGFKRLPMDSESCLWYVVAWTSEMCLIKLYAKSIWINLFVAAPVLMPCLLAALAA